MFLFESKRPMLVLVTLLSLLLSACGGLAGEPEIISTIPPRPTSAPVASVADIVIPENIDVALGEEIYAARCTACHGETGVGDGAMVLNGQIESIPDFTDPATIADKTLANYYDIITNGVLERLMPPWKDALSEEERWAVAQYTYSLAGDTTNTTATGTTDTNEDSAPLPASTEDATSATTDETTTGTTDETTVENTSAIGVVRGVLNNGTEGATIPAGQEVVLHIMDMEMNDNIYNAVVDDSGAFTFEDVPFIAERGYLITTEYNGGYFLSDMAFVEPTDAELALDISIYEATSDAGALHINTVVYQIEVVPDAIQVGQYMVVTNTSDRVFVSESTTEDEPRVSLGVELPQNAVFVPWANDPQRYTVSDDGRTVYDTQAILPGAEQLVQIVYSFDAENAISFQQTLPALIVGVADIYASNTAISLVAEDLQTLEPQTFGSQMYNGWRSVQNDTEIAFTIEYDANNSGLVGGGEAVPVSSQTQDNLPLGLILIFVGGGTLGAAGVMYYRARRDNHSSTSDQPVPPMPQDTPANALIKQIAELDLQYQNGELPQDVYEQQRQQLKTQLAQLMKQQANKS